MRGTRIRMAAAVAAIALTAGATTACGGDDDKDGAGKPVRVGGIFDLSGETADVGTPYANGIKGFVRYWNEAGEGPQIDLTSEDYRYDRRVAKGLYTRLKQEGVVALQGWGTGDTEALGDRVTADRIPFMSASYSDILARPSTRPFNFVPATSYSDQMRIALQWISEQASGAEVASFHDDSRFGESPQKAGQQAAKELGLGFKRYPLAAKVEDNVAKLRGAQSQGAKFVVIQDVATPAAHLVKQIAELRLDMQAVCLNWCGDELFIELAGSAARGTVGVMPFAPVSVKAEGFAQPRTFLAKRGRTLDQEGLHYIQGWYTMAVMAEGIKLAADRGTVTGESIRQALEDMDPFDTGGVSAPVDFTAASHAGMKAAKLYVVKNEQWSELTDLRKGS